MSFRAAPGGRRGRGTAWYARVYDPVRAGKIDGRKGVVGESNVHVNPEHEQGTTLAHMNEAAEAHDHGIIRALEARDHHLYHSHYPPSFTTVFVTRLHPKTLEGGLVEHFSRCGKIVKVKASVLRNIVTGESRQSAFVEFAEERSCREAFKTANKTFLDGQQILVDYQRGNVMEGWIPRRFGGGLGGRQESGQLRFGSRDRPFKEPIHTTESHRREIEDTLRYEDCWREVPQSKDGGSQEDPERRRRRSRSRSRSRRRDQAPSVEHDRDKDRSKDRGRRREGERDRPKEARHQERDARERSRERRKHPSRSRERDTRRRSRSRSPQRR